MPTNRTLTARQKKAIKALLTSWNTKEAANAAGVSRDTLYRWQKIPLFQEALQAASQASMIELSRGLITLGKQAITALEKALFDPKQAVRAADIILTKLMAMREAVDFEARITALEKEVQNEKH